LGLALVVVVALLHTQKYRYYLFDDAHITFRYAENLATGKGFVYNPGERVEGTSTFLLTVLLAAALALGAQPLPVAQLIGVAATLGILFYVFATVRLVLGRSRGELFGLGAALATAASTPLAVYAMSGLETNLFVCLLCAGLYYYLRDLPRGSSARRWPIALGLACLTRPEGVGFFLALWALGFGRELRVAGALGAALRRAACQAAWFLAVFGPLLAFRLLYFGELVPNTVIAKSTFQARVLGAHLYDALVLLRDGEGAKTALDFVDKVFGSLAVVAALGLLVKRARFATLALGLLSIVVVLVCVWNEGDWMPHYRLLVPLLPLGFMGMALGLGVLLDLKPEHVSPTWAPSVLALVVLLLATRRAHYDDSPRKRALSPAELHLVDLGRKLHAINQDGDLMATDIAGIIPFYAKMPTVDMFGLCDRHIAHHGVRGSKMGKTDYPYTSPRRQRSTCSTSRAACAICCASLSSPRTATATGWWSRLLIATLPAPGATRKCCSCARTAPIWPSSSACLMRSS